MDIMDIKLTFIFVIMCIIAILSTGLELDDKKTPNVIGVLLILELILAISLYF